MFADLSLERQVPLLFALYDDETDVHTSKNNVALSIMVDGHPAVVQKIASSKIEINFDDFFENYQIKPYGYNMYLIENGVNVFPDYVNFIEADLSMGCNSIVATYDAMPYYRDTNALTYEYNYDYSFDPIKIKKGFTNTTIHLNLDGVTENVSFRIFPDSRQYLTSMKNETFTFEEDLPEAINFSYQRQFPAWVKILVTGPALGFFILFCVLAARWHIKEIKKSSDSNTSSILGCLFIAVISILFISTSAYTLYRFLAYIIIKAQIIEDVLIVFGFLAYVILLLLIAPFYSAFIYLPHSQLRK